MKRMWAVAAIVVGALIMSVAAAWVLAKPPAYVPARFQARLQQWRLMHPTYSWAQDADCRCADDLVRQRTVSAGAWKAIPNYHPYLAYGDFDGDQRKDVAIGVRRAGEAGAYHVLILSGRPEMEPFLSEPFELGDALFFGAPRPKPWRLLIGPFESDAGGTFEPVKGGGYRFTPENCCDGL